MPIVNSDISSSLVRPNYASPARDLVYARTDFLDFLERNGLSGPSGGSSPITWSVITAGNSSSETYVENQALPTAGKPTWVRASQAVTYFRDVASMTGHVQDQIRNGGTYEDVWRAALDDAMRRLRYYVEQQLLGSTQDLGIGSIIDASDTYAGLAPGSYALWASEENTSIGTLTLSAMQDLYVELIASDHGATPTDVLLPPNLLRRYTDTAGWAASNGNARWNVDAGVAYDPSMLRMDRMPSFSGVPLTSIGAMTTTELYMIDRSAAPFGLRVHRDWTVEPIAKTNDNTEAAITFAAALVVENRHVHGKMTGVTA